MFNDNNVLLSVQRLPYISRRALFRRAGEAAGGAIALLATGLPARANVNQDIAGYQSAPNGEQSCGSCTHFKPPHSCELVEGSVSSSGWCKLFAKKS